VKTKGPDGSVVLTYANGVVMKLWPDGREEMHLPSGRESGLSIMDELLEQCKAEDQQQGVIDE
jgi:hypothetical protein